MALQFHPVQLEEYPVVYSYMAPFGEGSCQHSFVTMYSLFEKYGDMICEQDGFLYTLRSHLCDDQYRVYLAPMGSGDLQAAYLRILDDAHAYGKKAKFFTLTEHACNALDSLFPNLFQFENDRDLAEYMYPTAVMSVFPGKALKKRRQEVNMFWNLYGARAEVHLITPEDHADILEFEQAWLLQNSEDHDAHALEREFRSIQMQLKHFDALHLSGIVLRIDGVVRGFGYGTKLGDQFYDALIEKGDKSFEHIHRVLRQESVKQCAMDCTYVNLEEDVGVEGLRKLKIAYQPEYLLYKYIAAER